MSVSSPPLSAAPLASTARDLYRAVWRWHFYAGVFVIPFLIILSLSGLMILFGPALEQAQHKDLYTVAASTQQALSASRQLEAVKAAYPKAELQKFRPNASPTESAQVALSQDGRDLTAFVNPYTGTVLGDRDNAQKLETLGSNIHGTLLLQDVGDRILEIAAGWAIVLLITGLYMWWPRKTKSQGDQQASFTLRRGVKGRSFWRDLHSITGFWIGGAMLFFLISGMAWTGIWGGKIVQAWNTFPAQMSNDVPKSVNTTASLNRPGEKTVPWNLEQSKLPQSGSAAGTVGIPAGEAVTLDNVVKYVRTGGASHAFWVALPQGKDGVWTASASTMSRDDTDARRDFTLHIDQYSGRVLAQIGWQQYSLGAKGMAAGIALHQGNYGWWNVLGNTLFCLGIITLCVSGTAMWWIRRPKGAFRLAPPPMPAMNLWKGAVAVLVVLGVAFPLVGMSLLTVLLLDFLIIRRIPALRSALG
jgi:uncharacterized iron-regulated membrane protein